MELSFLIVLALVSLVTGTPYGFGVNSGAVAKAEANAASGGFGATQPVPLSIPSGAGGGFSGSFSKSSSSSFASASSSSSSSSFSYSGTAANGNTGIGCQSLECKKETANIEPTSIHGSFNNGLHNTAIASSAAGAVAGSTPQIKKNVNIPCKGGSCYDLYNSQSNDCASGQCNPHTPSENIPNGYRPQQGFSINGDINQSDDNSSEKNKYNHETSQYDCTHGKCNHNSQPTVVSTEEQDIFIPPSAPSKHQTPSVYLNAPYFEPACSTHNCNQGPSSHYSNNKLPTSYNVPILGTSPSGADTFSLSDSKQSETCAEGNCIPYSPSKITSGPGDSLNSASASPSCKGTNCGSISPHVSANSGISNSNIHLGTPNSNAAGVQSVEHSIGGFNHINHNLDKLTESSTPNLGSQSVPIYDKPKTDNNAAQAYNPNIPKVHDGYVGLKNNIPQNKYFSQPFESLNPNLGSQNVPSNNLGYVNGGTHSSNDGVGIHAPSHFYPNSNASPQILSQKPDSEPQSPIQTSNHNKIKSFTGSTNNNVQGSLSSKSNTDATLSIPGYSKPISVPSPNPNLSGPMYTGGFGGPSGIIGGSLTHASPVAPEAISSKKEIPVYTGGFGAPAGPVDISFPAKPQVISKPEGYNKAPFNVNKFSHGSSYGTGEAINTNSQAYPGVHEGINKPSNSLVPPIQHFPTNALPSSSSVTLPNTPNLSKPIHDDTKLKVYTGGFGGPTGLLKPNEYNLPVKSPSSVSSSYNPSVCSGGACGTKEQNKETDRKSGASPNISSATSTATADAKAVSYIGGFGGPSGLLNPFDNRKQLKTDQIGHTSGYNKPIENINLNHGKKAAGGYSAPSGLLSSFDYGKPSKSDYIDSIDYNAPEASGSHVEPTGNIDSTRSDKSSTTSFNRANTPVKINAGAQANAVAFATSNVFGANGGASSSGCNTGCGSAFNSENLGDSVHAGSQAVLKTGNYEANSGAGALAAATSNANSASLAAGGNFARSLASAHASTGALVKGGYGK